MYYTIYKTTNLINGKYYIGAHQTPNLNDHYLGSGKLLRRAIKKHGTENFKKEILFVFNNEEEMYSKEKELVNINNKTYNVIEGGHGGWNFLTYEDRRAAGTKGGSNSKGVKKYSNINYKRPKSLTHRENIRQALLNKPFSEERKKNISLGRKKSAIALQTSLNNLKKANEKRARNDS